MSDENNTNTEASSQEEKPKVAEESSVSAAGLLNTLKGNPKAIYAAAGAVVLVILISLMSGGEKPTQIKSASVSIGQQVTIQNPNIGNTILVAVPGKLGSADTEEDESILCRNVVAGTQATVEEEQTINYISFVKVTIKDGECQGKTGWMPKVNIKS